MSSKLRKFAFAVSVALFAPLISATEEERAFIRSGDISAFVAAIEAANAGEGPPRIELRTGGRYTFGKNDRLPPIRRPIEIFTSSALLSGDSGGPVPLFEIAESGGLTISGVRFRDFWSASESSGLITNRGESIISDIEIERVPEESAAAFVLNEGSVAIDDVAFDDFGPLSGPFLDNRGAAEINVTHIAYREFQESFAAIRNTGNLTLLNTTIAGYGASLLASSEIAAIATGRGGRTRFGNSLIVWSGADVCSGVGALFSLGHNSLTDATCRLAGSNDFQSVRPRFPSFERFYLGRRMLFHYPPAAGVSVDSADPAFALGVQGIRPSDGNVDGIIEYDRGAIEVFENMSAVSSGQGATGLFFDPDNDGHYVSVVVNPVNTLVTWSTFDKTGAPRWVIATGELSNGGSFIGEAFITVGGRLQPGRPPVGQEAERWGTLRIEFRTCEGGFVVYDSDLPEFGAGQFSIKRLAFNSSLGCSERLFTG